MRLLTQSVPLQMGASALPTSPVCARCAQSGFNEVQVLHMRPGDPHYSGNVVIVSAIGLTVLALLVAVVAALSDSSPGQEGRAQFATVEKADVHASVPRMAV